MPSPPDPSAAHRFGLNRNVAVLMAVVLVVGTGEELWVRFLPAYLEELGGGLWVVAAYGALFALLDGVYQYPGGWAADRLGRRRALTLFILAAAVGYAVYFGTHRAWVIAGTRHDPVFVPFTPNGVGPSAALPTPPFRTGIPIPSLSPCRRPPCRLIVDDRDIPSEASDAPAAFARRDRPAPGSRRRVRS